MSIAQEVIRIQNNRNTIRDKLVTLGMATSVDGLDKLAAAISEIEDQGAVEAEVKEGETYTVPKGYHNGTGTVTGISGGGSYKLQPKEATPTKEQQSLTPDEGFYGLSGVTVKPIPDSYQDVSSVTAQEGDVMAGKIFVASDGSSKAGTIPDNGAASKALDGMAVESVTFPAGYYSSVTVTLADTIETALALI